MGRNENSEIATRKAMTDFGKIHHRAFLVLVVVLTSIWLGVCGAGVANAGTGYEVKRPVSSDTIQRGYWHGAWTATTTYSEVHIVSLLGVEYCEASQDGRSIWNRVSAKQTCEVSRTGGSSTNGDYVKYGVDS